MTPSRKLALVIILACMKLAMLVQPVPAHSGETRRLRKETRITVLKPVRAQGRAAAGYPVLSTVANSTRVAANVSGLLNPIGWFF